MGIHYEFGFICPLKENLSKDIKDTLAYMTREEDYDFQPILKDRLFCPEAYPNPEFYEERLTEWRNIISNTPENRQPNITPSDHVSLLTDEFLCFRLYAKDDSFGNSIIPLLEWLVTICDTVPYEMIGFYEEICHPETRRLLGFNQGEIFEREVTSALHEDVEQLRQEIIDLLPDK